MYRPQYSEYSVILHQLFKYNNSTFMLEAGMTVNATPLTVAGRELPTPRVVYGNNSTLVSVHLVSHLLAAH